MTKRFYLSKNKVELCNHVPFFGYIILICHPKCSQKRSSAIRLEQIVIWAAAHFIGYLLVARISLEGCDKKLETYYNVTGILVSMEITCT